MSFAIWLDVSRFAIGSPSTRERAPHIHQKLVRQDVLQAHWIPPSATIARYSSARFLADASFDGRISTEPGNPPLAVPVKDEEPAFGALGFYIKMKPARHCIDQIQFDLILRKKPTICV